QIEDYLDKIPLIPINPNTIADKHTLRQCLKEAQENGYATERGELIMGIGCIAVPIFDFTGKAMGAISLSGTPDILVNKLLPEVVANLIQTGIEISRRMGYRPEAMQAQAV
ncbi:MAG: IclR family transcriptional regulator C-terminal domain-containing protein, partial [Deltaproteobacteria bacterium]|nr:IclR family transcriptional regulator C-terminal domain-containing protein [Deltaproteobacteria bacterium]